MPSFNEIAEQIRDAFPAGKALPVYDRGFRDALESTVLAMRAHRLSAGVVQDVVTTAMDAFSNNAPHNSRNDTAATPRAFDHERVAAKKAAAKAELFTKTDATGVLFFQALQDEWRLEVPMDKAKTASAMNRVIADVESAEQETVNSRLHFLNYAGLIELAVMEHHYSYLTHAKPSGEATSFSPVDAVGFNEAWGDDTKAKIADGVARRFDYIFRANDPTVDRMSLCRLSDEPPQAHEWGIAPGLVGVALPNEMFQYFLAEAAERARPADIEQQGDDDDDAAPAPGQGG